MVEVSLSEDDREDGVRSATRLVHVGRRHCSVYTSSTTSSLLRHFIIISCRNNQVPQQQQHFIDTLCFENLLFTIQITICMVTNTKKYI